MEPNRNEKVKIFPCGMFQRSKERKSFIQNLTEAYDFFFLIEKILLLFIPASQNLHHYSIQFFSCFLLEKIWKNIELWNNQKILQQMFHIEPNSNYGMPGRWWHGSTKGHSLVGDLSSNFGKIVANS